MLRGFGSGRLLHSLVAVPMCPRPAWSARPLQGARTPTQCPPPHHLHGDHVAARRVVDAARPSAVLVGADDLRASVGRSRVGAGAVAAAVAGATLASVASYLVSALLKDGLDALDDLGAWVFDLVLMISVLSRS